MGEIILIPRIKLVQSTICSGKESTALATGLLHDNQQDTRTEGGNLSSISCLLSWSALCGIFKG